MQNDTTGVASAIFAANRARGAVTFDKHLPCGRQQRRATRMNPACCGFALPHPRREGLSAVFVNTAGGVAGGDRFDIDIAAGEGARLTC